ncbi:hypothetical protein EGW08_007188 [Elysia chlorotica]|uniref:Uncharacterized protein n=1 Tax=Elysia chlorotica TaxID=188477 RepID=A0A3S1A865_ELYCH|nr:hypothetical protein EGW08_007188 [Elysia chlorotica]
MRMRCSVASRVPTTSPFVMTSSLSRGSHLPFPSCNGHQRFTFSLTLLECCTLVRGSQCKPSSLSHSIPLFQTSIMSPVVRTHIDYSTTGTHNRKSCSQLGSEPFTWMVVDFTFWSFKVT